MTGQHVELASKKKEEISQHFELATSKNIYEKRTADV